MYLGIAVGLGMLVGLQREHSASVLAGFRTFPLITVLGTMASLASVAFGPWLVVAGLLALAGVVIAGNVAAMRRPDYDPGVTTEAAILVMYCVGAYLPVGPIEVAIAVGAGVAVLLHAKERLHGLAAKLSESDLRSIMQFVLLALVILPALPNRAFDAYGVLNPYKIWLMVVLIVGISFGGYIAYKFYGGRAGTILGGVLGGLISSTATTVSYARRATSTPAASGVAVIIITIASGIVFARLFVELAMTAPGSIYVTGPPMLIMLAAMAALSAGAWFFLRGPSDELSVGESKSELKSAVAFGLLYAVVLYAAAAAKEHFGDSGLYVVAAISGLTDVDAITLSSAELINLGALDAETGWRLVLLAATTNLVFKAGAVALLGTRALFLRVLAVFAVAIVVAGLLFLFW
ncbi:MAG: MgtC/SapB family protein [Blastocatellia bacterium]|nr:MgtC/SapB family protein [Blastocatellia bacterium]